jgi:hypothetical protein
MNVSNELIDSLLADYKKPEDLFQGTLPRRVSEMAHDELLCVVEGALFHRF